MLKIKDSKDLKDQEWRSRINMDLSNYVSKYPARTVLQMLVDAVDQLLTDPMEPYILKMRGMDLQIGHFISNTEGKRIMEMIGFRSETKNFEMVMILRAMSEPSRHYAWFLNILNGMLEQSIQKEVEAKRKETIRIQGDQERLDRVRMLIKDDQQRRQKISNEISNSVDLRALRRECPLKQ